MTSEKQKYTEGITSADTLDFAVQMQMVADSPKPTHTCHER